MKSGLYSSCHTFDVIIDASELDFDDDGTNYHCLLFVSVCSFVFVVSLVFISAVKCSSFFMFDVRVRIFHVVVHLQTTKPVRHLLRSCGMSSPSDSILLRPRSGGLTIQLRVAV